MAQEQAPALEELKGVIFSIEENYELPWIPASGVNAGQELFKHKVTLYQDGTKNKVEGVFFQRTKDLMFNKEKCFIGQEICYTSRPPKRDGTPMVFTMCNEKGVSAAPLDITKIDVSKTNGVSFSYAKDIVIASFAEQGKTVDEYLVEIKRVATDIKNFLLENN